LDGYRGSLEALDSLKGLSANTLIFGKTGQIAMYHLQRLRLAGTGLRKNDVEIAIASFGILCQGFSNAGNKQPPVNYLAHEIMLNFELFEHWADLCRSDIPSGVQAPRFSMLARLFSLTFHNLLRDINASSQVPCNTSIITPLSHLWLKCDKDFDTMHATGSALNILLFENPPSNLEGEDDLSRVNSFVGELGCCSVSKTLVHRMKISTDANNLHCNALYHNIALILNFCQNDELMFLELLSHKLIEATLSCIGFIVSGKAESTHREDIESLWLGSLEMCLAISRAIIEDSHSWVPQLLDGGLLSYVKQGVKYFNKHHASTFSEKQRKLHYNMYRQIFGVLSPYTSHYSILRRLKKEILLIEPDLARQLEKVIGEAWTILRRNAEDRFEVKQLFDADPKRFCNHRKVLNGPLSYIHILNTFSV
jgi:hypothetical protein